MRLFFLALTFFFLFSIGCYASEVSLKGRTIINNCNDFNNITSDFVIRYKNSELPYGTKVYLIFTPSAMNNEVRDENSSIIEMKLLEPFMWTILNSIVISNRESNYQYSNINFVFKLVLPSGRIFFDKGSYLDSGYYQVKISNEKTCVNSENEYPEFKSWDILNKSKNQ